MKLQMMLVWVLGSLLLVSCGGGGGSSNNNSGGIQNSGLTIDSAPTAKISGSQTNANTLSQEVQSDVPSLIESTSALNLPGAINALPGGVTSTSINCSTLGTSGSGTISYSTDATGSTPTAGSVVNISYNSCSFTSGSDTTTINGTVKVTIDSYVDSLNMSATIVYSNFTISSTGTNSFTYGPISGSYSYSASNGVYTYSVNLSNGGVSNISASDVIINGSNVTITNATYVYNSSSAGGVIKVVFNNWTYDSTTGIPSSGAITVTGANGDTIEMTANGDNTVTVTYNINGSTSSFTVTFS